MPVKIKASKCVTIRTGLEKPPSNHKTIQVIQGGSNMTGTNCDLFTHK
jgi:hypothetical protein